MESSAITQEPVSPIRQASLSGADMELTPRSKVQAMLADLDSNSEPDSARQSPRSHNKTTTPQLTYSTQKQNQLSSETSSCSTNPGAKPGVASIRSRLLPEDATEREESNDESGTESSAEDAYERVRNQLLSATRPVHQDGADDARSKDTQEVGLVSPTSTRQSSPGLFVSPEKVGADIGSNPGSDSDDVTLEKSATVSERLKALVARKREERLSKESEKAESSDDEVSSMPQISGARRSSQLQFELDNESDGDNEDGKKLTQYLRPTRKASKKAMEEMHRETQRMSRNMQLTHEARTRTKFTTEGLFAKFNFRQTKEQAGTGTVISIISDSSGTSSDADPSGHQETPPSSPPSVIGDSSTTGNLDKRNDTVNNSEAGLPTRDDLVPSKTLATKTTDSVNSAASSNMLVLDEKAPKRASVKRLQKSVKRMSTRNLSTDDDDELEIEQPNRLPVFDNISARKIRDPASMHTLRALACLTDQKKMRGKIRGSMTPSELQSSLHRRARQQGLEERNEKIQRLREKGVLIQTDEEKEREQMQLENMLEKARQEAEDIAKREKEDAKKEREKNGESPNSDGDEDYQASEDESEVEFSGSDDEERDQIVDGEAEEVDGSDEDDDAGDDANEDEGPVSSKGALVKDISTGEADYAEDTSKETDHDGIIKPSNIFKSKRQSRKVIDSDDEDDQISKEANVKKDFAFAEPATPAAAKTPRSVRSDAFGFSNKKPAPLGLSQVFAGTMAEDPTQFAGTNTTRAIGVPDPFAFLKMLSPGLPTYRDNVAPLSPETVVQDSQESQTPDSRQRLGAAAENSIDLLSPSLNDYTQVSDLPEPTQDDGFQIRDSQPIRPEETHSTIDTILLESSSQHEVTAKPRRRLHRINTMPMSPIPDDEEIEEGESQQNIEANLERPKDLLQLMREARAKTTAEDIFDKKQSKAKEMFEEQAEESEDEYAGLGGASDDESQGEIDEETKRMIDDQSNEKTDERDIAAYYAEKARVEDEKGIEKLYKDVINGGLRRKRGAEYDLWDSDDEDEATARRRAAKQREFAKMRKALLADEKIGKIAANPKQAAFLQAIEDRDEIDEIDYLDRPDESFTTAVPDSQREQSPAHPLTTISANNAGTKRTHDDFEERAADSQDAENMPPPVNARRSKIAKVTKPTSLAQIRSVLSEMIGEPESILESQHLDTDLPQRSDDDDDDDEHDRHHSEEITNIPESDLWHVSSTPTAEPQNVDAVSINPFPGSLPSPPPEPRFPNPRRTQATVRRTEVIDRIALKKQASSLSTSRGEDSQSRLAFHNPSSMSFTSKVPSLLRRATTNGSFESDINASASSSSGIGGLGGKDTVKRGGTAKSSVNYYVRDMERKAKLQKVEQERIEGRERMGKMRREVLSGKDSSRSGGGGGLAGLVGGGFE